MGKTGSENFQVVSRMEDIKLCLVQNYFLSYN